MNQIDQFNKDIYKCIQEHRTEYPDPIDLTKGEVVKLGNNAPEENWKTWIWVSKNNGKGGWVPEQLIQLIESQEEEKKGLILGDYSSKELNADLGDRLEKVKAMNGWTWVRNVNTNQEGWIPDEKIMRIDGR